MSQWTSFTICTGKFPLCSLACKSTCFCRLTPPIPAVTVLSASTFLDWVYGGCPLRFKPRRAILVPAPTLGRCGLVGPNGPRGQSALREPSLRIVSPEHPISLPGIGMPASQQHAVAVARTLRYAVDAAAGGDYTDALAWLATVEAIGDVLPDEYETMRVAWVLAVHPAHVSA
jgi:hypothetical protein